MKYFAALDLPVAPGRYRPLNGALRIAGLLVVASTLTACATRALDRAPASPQTPWQPSEKTRESGSNATSTTTQSAPGFGVPPVPELGYLSAPPTLDPKKPLQLPELIDIAQREHPETRMAWNRARQAALAVGVVEATFLPMLSANVVAGYQRTRHPLPVNIAGHDAINTELRGVVPALTLGWLLFDFGQRAALYDAASELSFAANVLFNASHQKIIRDVTDQFYQYNTARARSRLAKEALANQTRVENAVKQRQKAGIATTIELALARQAVAQARLYVVESEGLERNTYLALLNALGVSPTTRLTVAEPELRTLPKASDPLTSEAIQKALTERPDLVAGYAAMKSAQAGVRAAEADFLPKIYLGAVAAHNRVTFDVVGLPGLSQTATSRGVLLGVALPIFDGGLRRARVKAAEIRVDEAQQILQRQQRDAVREIVAAETVLQTALQSLQAAADLVITAQTAHDAAYDAYQNGVGTVSVATDAATQLLKARQARTDTYNASLAAAANLAFVMGQMTAPKASWLP